MKTQKGNAVITGQAGAGKTALVELFARAIDKGEVPEQLRNAILFEVSLSKLLAGTMYRGQFEERLDKLLNELKANPQTILFIDEMHLLWGAGRTSESAMDASNILKPFLARGEIRMIGATTTEDYHRYIARDSALERRFEVLPLEAPSGELLHNLVAFMAESIHSQTGIDISEDVPAAAISLTDRYLPQRSQPDKAINLLDLAAAKARMTGAATVTRAMLMKLLADQTGQPISELDAVGQESLAGMESRINRQLIARRMPSIRSCARSFTGGSSRITARKGTWVPFSSPVRPALARLNWDGSWPGNFTAVRTDCCMSTGGIHAQRDSFPIDWLRAGTDWA